MRKLIVGVITIVLVLAVAIPIAHAQYKTTAIKRVPSVKVVPINPYQRTCLKKC